MGVVLVAVLLVAACSGATGEGPATGIDAPNGSEAPVETLEPRATPTPLPDPTPSPPPLPPPGGAWLRSAAGVQEGAPSSFCWAGAPGGASECQEHPTPAQAQTLTVGSGETTLLVIEAEKAPDEQSIRPFQGTRSGYPSQRLTPALETELVVDLSPGEWTMDLCATWHRHGQPICWLFRLDVPG